MEGFSVATVDTTGAGDVVCGWPFETTFYHVREDLRRENSALSMCCSSELML